MQSLAGILSRDKVIQCNQFQILIRVETELDFQQKIRDYSFFSGEWEWEWGRVRGVTPIYQDVHYLAGILSTDKDI